MPTSTFHTRIARAPQQTEFAPQRTSKRRQPRHSLPLQREQSTLTQINWVTSSSHTSVDHLSEGSDHCENDESDFAEMPPKKRRRTYGRGRAMKQTTVTQNWRDFVRESSDSSHGENAENVDPEACHDGTGESVGTARTPNDATLDHAKHLLSIASSQQSRRALHMDSSDNEHPSATSTPASSVKVYKTPQKPRRTVVPSSETPSSIHLSEDQDTKAESSQHSPLKERSSNVRPSQKYSSAFGYSQKRRGRIGSSQSRQTRKGDRKDNTTKAAPVAKLDFHAQRPTRSGDRTLQRVTTIQDSDDDEIGVMELEEEQQERLASTRALPALHWRTTVQESQIESDMEELEAEVTRSNDLFEVNTMTATYDPMFQQTFDPTSMALERDAVRFGRDNTQFTTYVRDDVDSLEQPSPSREHTMSLVTFDHDQMAEDTQLIASSQQIGPDSARAEYGEDGHVSDTASEPGKHASHSTLPLALGVGVNAFSDHQLMEHRSTTSAGSSDLRTHSEQARPITTVESEEEHNCDRIPSSIEQELSGRQLGTKGRQQASQALQSAENVPNTSRCADWEHDHERIPQSQISTVMPTQRSRPRSAHGRSHESEQQTHPAAFVNTLSSSPFPMPPCDDTQGHYIRTETQITDFSLPLPPLFSSSPRRGSSL